MAVLVQSVWVQLMECSGSRRSWVLSADLPKVSVPRQRRVGLQRLIWAQTRTHPILTSDQFRSSLSYSSPTVTSSHAAEVTRRWRPAAPIGRQRPGNDRRSRTLSDQMDVEPRLGIWTQTLHRSEFTCRRAGAGWMTCQPKERGRGLTGLKAPKTTSALTEKMELFIKSEQWKLYTYYQTNTWKGLPCLCRCTGCSGHVCGSSTRMGGDCFSTAVNPFSVDGQFFYASEANGSVLAAAAGLELTPPPPHSSG